MKHIESVGRMDLVNLAFIARIIDEACYFIDEPFGGKRKAYHDI
jgi:hypothetical protein